MRGQIAPTPERIRRRLRSWVERSPLLSSLNYGKGQVAYRFGLRRHRSGATLARLTLEQSVEYVHRCGGDYLRYAGVSEHHLAGRRVLELGPGDNLGMALYLLAKGAARVVCVDAFDALEDPRRTVELYRALFDSFSPAERERAERGLRIADDRSVELMPQYLSVHRRTRIDHAPPALARERFDLILSRAVLEHVADVKRSWAAMTGLLDPAGEMWHKIDLRHHGYFGRLHPLHFLSLSDRAWTWIASPDPTLNRRRADTYRSLVAESFEQSKILVTHVLDRDEIVPHVERLVPGVHYGDRELALLREIRPRLVARFRDLSDSDLLVTGIFVVARAVRRRADSHPQPASRASKCRSDASQP